MKDGKIAIFESELRGFSNRADIVKAKFYDLPFRRNFTYVLHMHLSYFGLMMIFFIFSSLEQ